MPAGFQTWCADGSGAAQIDGNYQNYFFRRKGSSATTSIYFSVSGGNVSSVVVNCGSFVGRPVVAFRSTALLSAGPPVKGSDGNWTSLVLVRGEIGSAFTWYAFDTLDVAEAASTRFGLQVFNAQGKVVFDASRKPMRVVGVLSVNGDGTGQTLNLPAGPDYAVLATPGGRMIPAGAGASIVLTYGSSVNSGTLALGSFQVGTYTVSSTTQLHPSYGIAVNVTSY